MAQFALTSRSEAIVFGLALALRLALFHLPALSNILADRVEISTPITGFKRPIGYMLLQITAIKDSESAKEKKILQYGNKIEDPGMNGLTVAILYLFNPFTIASCIGKSTILYSNVAVVSGIWMGMRRNKSLAMFSIALATYLSLYPAMLFIPVLLMLARDASDDNKKKTPGTFLAAFMGPSVSDLTPNLGLFWYFYIEMFDQFRPFFLVVFQMHVFIFAVPISFKLRKYPLFVSFLMCAIMGTFKGYPSVGDASLYLGLLPLSSEIFKYLRYTFLIVNLFLYSSLLAPIFWHLWVYVGSGNANFFYAIGLVYGIGEIILMIDTTYAVSRRDFEALVPPDASDDKKSTGWDREVIQAQ
ncbi:hypothetical protein BGX21_004142 [Mortierella sp. AD011]|nr:hypothetical protein BGX21_004142 [Mortierella sp. AD011]